MGRSGWVCLLFALGAVLVGCHPGLPKQDPFVRNRLDGLRRAVISARDAQDTATNELLSSLADLDSVEAQGMTPQDAYSAARRHVAVTDSRVRNSARRQEQMKAAARSVFDEWSRENRSYSDDGYAATARAKQVEIEGRYQVVQEALRSAEEAMYDVQLMISDRMLYFKHRRDEPLATTPPANSTNRLPPPPQKLRTLTDEAVLECNEFVDLVMPKEKSIPAADPGDPYSPPL